MKHSILAVCGLLTLSSVVSSSAQELSPLPEPIAPSQNVPILPEPIGAAPVANAPLKGIKNRVADEREAIKASAELVLPRLLKRELTVHEAWEKKLLTAPHTEYLLGDYLNIWGGFTWAKWGGIEWADEVELRRGLTKQLISHWEQSAPEKLQTTNLLKLNPRARLWIADYFQSIGDERAIVVTESLMSQLPDFQAKTNLKDEQGLAGFETLVFQICERMAWYYSGKEEYLKAAEAWLKVEALLPEQSRKKWFVPDSLVEAARCYMRLGDEKKAQQFYAKVISTNGGWLHGVAIYDVSNSLIKQGRHIEAQALLKKEIAQPSTDGTLDVRVAWMSTLGRSLYQSGDLQGALHYSREAIALYKSLSNPLKGMGLEAQVALAEETLKQAKLREEKSLSIEPRQLRVVQRKNEKMITHWFRLQGKPGADISVTSTDPRVQVQLSALAENPSVYDIAVKIAPDAAAGYEATLSVANKKTNEQLHVQVFVDVS